MPVRAVRFRIVSHRGGPPDDKSDRVRPGSSCHKRKCTRTRGIRGNRRQIDRTQVLGSAPARDSQVRRHTPHPAPPQPARAFIPVLAKPRTAMINTSQHNCAGPVNPWDIPV